ncbi:MAG: efflux RND transporter periplasmic adaptor subunit [Bacteroidales bacterium]|nr:efflux RND transporter periplasmic adaptor subunit [Bacteroidales bacterium]
MDKFNNNRKRYKRILNVVVYAAFGVLLVYHIVSRDQVSKLYVTRNHLVVSPASDTNFEEYIDGFGVLLPEYDRIPTLSPMRDDEPLRLIPRQAYVEVSSTELDPHIDFRCSDQKQNTCSQSQYSDEEMVCDQELKDMLRHARINIDQQQRRVKDGTFTEDDFNQAIDDYSQILEGFCNLTLSKGKEALANISITIDKEQELEIEEELEELQNKLAELTISTNFSGSDDDQDSDKKDVDFWMNLRDAKVHMKAEVHRGLLPGARAGQLTEIMIHDKPYIVEIAEVEDQDEDEYLIVDFSFIKELDSNIKIGQALPLKIKIKEQQESILLKQGCYFQETGGHWVYVLSDDGSYAVKRKIRLGKKHDQYVEVIDGLEPGERVIISSYKHFKNKDKLIFK